MAPNLTMLLHPTGGQMWKSSRSICERFDYFDESITQTIILVDPNMYDMKQVTHHPDWASDRFRYSPQRARKLPSNIRQRTRHGAWVFAVRRTRPEHRTPPSPIERKSWIGHRDVRCYSVRRLRRRHPSCSSACVESTGGKVGTNKVN